MARVSTKNPHTSFPQESRTGFIPFSFSQEYIRSSQWREWVSAALVYPSMLPGLGHTVLAVNHPGIGISSAAPAGGMPGQGCCDLTERLGFLVISPEGGECLQG